MIYHINESSISFKSELDKDYKSKGKKSLSSFKQVSVDRKFLKEHKGELPHLGSLRHSDDINTSIAWMDNDIIVGYIGISHPNDDKWGKYIWGTALEVNTDYKGYGLGDQIFKYGLSKGINALGVAANNKVAIVMYKKYGFEVSEEDSTQRNLIMYKKDSMNESANSNTKIFHLSQQNLDGKTLKPRIPDNFMTKNGYEDNTTPRVSFAPKIDYCLRAINQKCKNMILYVHIPDGDYDTHVATVKEVPDAKLTKEVWITSPVKMKCIGKIKVIDDKGEDGLPYTYGPGGKYSAELYDWSWKWIENMNESAYQNYDIYYALTKEESRKKVLHYKSDPRYNGKFVNTTLNGLKRFIRDNNMEDVCPYYTILSVDRFEIDDSIDYDKEYDMIAVKTPFTIEIDKVYKLDFSDESEILYHGSHDIINGSLKPNISTHGKKWLYATPDYSFALPFCADRSLKNDFVISQGSINGQPYLMEMIDNAFDIVYNNKKGYIYTLPSDKFKRLEGSKKEYVSTVPVKPIGVKEIPDILKEIKSTNTLLYRNDENPKWFINLLRSHGLKNKNEYLLYKANQIYKMTHDKGVYEDLHRLHPDIEIPEEYLNESSNITNDFFAYGNAPFRNPDQLLEWMSKNFTYRDGNNFIVNDPYEMIKKKTGNCYDQTLFALKALDTMGYDCGARFMVEFFKWPEGGSTHTCAWYIDDDKYLWFENAWENHRGIHGPYNSIEELDEAIVETWIKDGNYGKYDKLYITEMSKRCKAGMNLEQWVNACTPKKEPKGKLVHTLPLLNNTFYRITYNGIGIEAIRQNVSMDVWKRLKSSSAFTWLPVPNIPYGGHRSYFTQEGYDEFNKKTLPVVKKYLDISKMDVQKVSIDASKAIYKDKYQIVVPAESINESYIINEKDIYHNKDKFDSGEINLCFITGHSGSGKSTMGRDMTKDSKIEHYELDDLQCIADHFTLENLKEYGDLIYSYFTGEGKKFYTTYQDLVDNKIPGSEYEDKLFPGFVHYAMKYAKSHPNTKFVLEGVWLFCSDENNKPWFNPEEFKDYAFYIKGTSALISHIRAAKRDSKDAKNKFDRFKSFAKAMAKNNKWYFIDEKRIKMFRDYFKKLDKESSVNESANELPTIYHVSDKNFNGKTLRPRIPSYMSPSVIERIKSGEMPYEDYTTKRISFSKSITHCLRGIFPLENYDPKLFVGEIFYAHIPDTNNFKYLDTDEIVDKVWDAKYTQEVWVTSPVKMKCIGKFKITGFVSNEWDGIDFNYEMIEDYNVINESADQSKIDPSHKQSEIYKLSSYKMISKDKTSDGIRSEYLIWKDGSKKVGQVWADADKASDGNIWFGSLEVSKAYRGHGLSEQILDYIISKYHSNALTVYKDNEVAIRLYKKKGFKIVKNASNVSDEYYTMIRNSSVNESMGDVISAALAPNPLPYESDKENYYIIQYPKNNVFNYTITKDPVQYSMFSVDPESKGFYKVYKSDKKKISNKYLTFKIKDRKSAKELYNELAAISKTNDSSFVDSRFANSNNYIYARLTEGNNIISDDQLLFDTRFELVKNPEDDINEICENLYNYLTNSPVMKLKEQLEDIMKFTGNNGINEDYHKFYYTDTGRQLELLSLKIISCNESKRDTLREEISKLGWNPEIPFNKESSYLVNKYKSGIINENTDNKTNIFDIAADMMI